MAKLTGSANHSIKQVALAEEINRCGQGEPFLLQAKMEKELTEEVPMCITTKEVIGKPTMGSQERLLLACS